MLPQSDFTQPHFATAIRTEKVPLLDISPFIPRKRYADPSARLFIKHLLYLQLASNYMPQINFYYSLLIKSGLTSHSWPLMLPFFTRKYADKNEKWFLGCCILIL